MSSDQFAKVRERANIVEVIGSYVQLTKKGQRHVGLCPFHAEKTPSFSVSLEKGLYYCFGCQRGGDVISFVQEHLGLGARDAADKLALDLGLSVDPRDQERMRQETAWTRLNDDAAAYFAELLWSPCGTQAQQYLATRGVPPAQAREWRLGYGGTAEQFSAFLAAHQVSQKLAQEVGLTDEQGMLRICQQRLVFPITDHARRTVGFGARQLGDAFGPKYLNTQETPLFHKSALLYGLDQARDAIRKDRQAILVEGYLDVLACHRAGVRGAVAALGTHFSEQHANRLRQWAEAVTLLLDGDAAGQAACRKVAPLLWQADLQVYLGLLPQGEDPDSVAKKSGAPELLKITKDAVPAMERFIEDAFRDAATIEERARAARSLQPMLRCLRGLERDLYIAKVAERVGVPPERLGGAPERPQRKTDVARTPAPDELVETDYLRELLLFPSLQGRLGEIADLFRSEPLRQVVRSLGDGLGLQEATAQPLAAYPVLLRRLAPRISPKTLETSSEAAERTFGDVARRLKTRGIDAAMAAVVGRLARAEAEGQTTHEIAELLRQKQVLTQERRALKAGA